MKNVIFCGVGGQGVILASKVLMETALQAGFDVKESEVHGMAQRGGSVECNVRYGSKVYSPLIDKAGADIIVSFELLEAVRKVEYLKADGMMLVNNLCIDPVPVQNGIMKYPEDLEQWLVSNLSRSKIVDTTDALKEVGSAKALNIMMLGVLSNCLDFTKEQWQKAIRACVKEKFIDMNLKAFELGTQLKNVC